MPDGVVAEERDVPRGLGVVDAGEDDDEIRREVDVAQLQRDEVLHARPTGEAAVHDVGARTENPGEPRRPGARVVRGEEVEGRGPPFADDSETPLRLRHLHLGAPRAERVEGRHVTRQTEDRSRPARDGEERMEAVGGADGTDLTGAPLLLRHGPFAAAQPPDHAPPDLEDGEEGDGDGRGHEHVRGEPANRLREHRGEDATDSRTLSYARPVTNRRRASGSHRRSWRLPLLAGRLPRPDRGRPPRREGLRRPPDDRDRGRHRGDGRDRPGPRGAPRRRPRRRFGLAVRPRNEPRPGSRGVPRARRRAEAGPRDVAAPLPPRPARGRSPGGAFRRRDRPVRGGVGPRGDARSRSLRPRIPSRRLRDLGLLRAAPGRGARRRGGPRLRRGPGRGPEFGAPPRRRSGSRRRFRRPPEVEPRGRLAPPAPSAPGSARPPRVAPGIRRRRLSRASPDVARIRDRPLRKTVRRVCRRGFHPPRPRRGLAAPRRAEPWAPSLLSRCGPRRRWPRPCGPSVRRSGTPLRRARQPLGRPRPSRHRFRLVGVARGRRVGTSLPRPRDSPPRALGGSRRGTVLHGRPAGSFSARRSP